MYLIVFDKMKSRSKTLDHFLNETAIILLPSLPYIQNIITVRTVRLKGLFKRFFEPNHKLERPFLLVAVTFSIFSIIMILSTSNSAVFKEQGAKFLLAIVLTLAVDVNFYFNNKICINEHLKRKLLRISTKGTNLENQ